MRNAYEAIHCVVPFMGLIGLEIRGVPGFEWFVDIDPHFSNVDVFEICPGQTVEKALDSVWVAEITVVELEHAQTDEMGTDDFAQGPR